MNSRMIDELSHNIASARCRSGILSGPSKKVTLSFSAAIRLYPAMISGSVSFGWKVMIQSHGLVLASSSISFIRWGAEHTLRVKVGG